MQTSETVAKLFAAMHKAQHEVGAAVKDSKNPHFKNTYASLNAHLHAVIPVYNAHGLAVIQAPGFRDGLCTLTTRVAHTSGEWLEFEAAAPLQRNDPQGVGSAITYLRRYSLGAVAGIGAEDDDGHSASTPDVRVLKSDLTGGMVALGDKLTDAERERISAAVASGDVQRMTKALAWLRGQQLERA